MADGEIPASSRVGTRRASRPEGWFGARQAVPQGAAGLGHEGVPRRSGFVRRGPVRAAPAMRVVELVAILRRRGDDRGNSLHRSTRTSIALREETTELFHRVYGIEIDRQCIR